VLSTDGTEEVADTRDLPIRSHAKAAEEFAADLADRGAAELIEAAREETRADEEADTDEWGDGAAGDGVGTVYLVGSGPGDPDLLTVRAAKLIELADVVLHDKLPGPEILGRIPEAKREDVGKRAGGEWTPQEYTNRRLVELARGEVGRPPERRRRPVRFRSRRRGRPNTSRRPGSPSRSFPASPPRSRVPRSPEFR